MRLRSIVPRTYDNERLCQDHGLKVARVVPVTAVWRDAAEADHILGLQRVTHRAVDACYLTLEEARTWLLHLQIGPMFASVTMFVTVATVS